jgi:hypothetical protein
MTDPTNDPQSPKPSDPAAPLQSGSSAMSPMRKIIDDAIKDVSKNAPSKASTEIATLLPIDAGMRELIEDVRRLLEYALSEARKSDNGPIDTAIVQPIVDIAYPNDETTPTKVEKTAWIAFLKSCDLLSARTSPVTARTLRDTQADEPNKLWQSIYNPRPPFKITRMLWLVTLFFVALAITNDFYFARWGEALKGQVDGGELRAQILGVLAPFIYGGLGACAYLLRSAHSLIAARTFNSSYKPEYLNRILLGVVSGGTATMFATNVVDADGQVLRLSQAAIGFLAGYSTDFLFKTIERLLEALFPRTNPPAKS